MSIEKKRNS